MVPPLLRSHRDRFRSGTRLERQYFFSESEDRRRMNLICNLNATDRSLRMIIGAGIGIGGILVSGHPWLGRMMGVAGALLILSAASGT